MATKTDAEYREEYEARKARRMAEASKHGTKTGAITYDGWTWEVRKAYRSHGYKSKYERVIQYWVLGLDEKRQLRRGFSLTESSFLQHREQVKAKTGLVLPV